MFAGSSSTVGYTYDATNGDRPTGMTYPSGQTLTYTYSGVDSTLGRLTSVQYSGFAGNAQSYGYLGLGTPVSFTDGNGVGLSYATYGVSTGDGGDQYGGLDRFGRVVAQNWTGPAYGGVSTRPGVDQLDYAYDPDGDVRLSRRTRRAR